jgi:Tol biopolymer transport system component
MMDRNQARAALALLVAFVTAGCGGGNGSDDSEPTPQIVFSSKRTGHPKLYRMNVSGGGDLGLTSGAWEDIAPAVSPAGDQVAFLTKQYSVYNQLAILDLGSGAVTRVLIDSVGHGAPSWSPDGQWIVFNRSWNCSCQPAIWKIRPTGLGLVALGASTDGHNPAWSPTGDKVVYATSTGLRLVDSSGANDTLLFDLGSTPERAAWSGSAGLIAFGRSGTFYVVQPNGAGFDTVVVAGHAMSNPAWSADGLWLYGSTNIDATGFAANYEIARVHPDGSGWTRITVNGDGSGGPPDDWPAWGELTE